MATMQPQGDIIFRFATEAAAEATARECNAAVDAGHDNPHFRYRVQRWPSTGAAIEPRMPRGQAHYHVVVRYDERDG